MTVTLVTVTRRPSEISLRPPDHAQVFLLVHSWNGAMQLLSRGKGSGDRRVSRASTHPREGLLPGERRAGVAATHTDSVGGPLLSCWSHLSPGFSQ